MRSRTFAALVVLALSVPALVFADDSTAPAASPSLKIATLKFFAGAAVGLVLHESGHVALDLAFDAHPRIVPVHLGFAPFFAITHRQGLSPRREYIIDSAGFWMQDIGSERLFATRPDLRSEHAPFTKGEFAFDEVTSIGYGIVALARAGPVYRDTRGMSASIGVPEPAIGTLVLVPALLDGYRYFRPESRWAKWTSRAAKISTVVLVFK